MTHSYWDKKSESGELLDRTPLPPTTALPLSEDPSSNMVSPEWQAEMARMFATMEDDEPVASTPNPPPVSHVRQCAPEGSTHGERGSHLLQGEETATRTEKAG